MKPRKVPSVPKDKKRKEVPKMTITCDLCFQRAELFAILTDEEGEFDACEACAKKYPK